MTRPGGPTHPTPTGPPRRSRSALVQRCPVGRPHQPHPVPPRGPITGFPCAGLDPAEIDRQLAELFGPVLAHWALPTS